MLQKNCLILLIFFNIPSMPVDRPVCISLGSACATGLILRKLGIRTEAYPFDWIVSPFESVYNALLDDFSFFLTNIQMRPDKQGIFDYYGFHFTHDLPTIQNPHIDALNIDFVGNNTLSILWENALPLIREKYYRRITRFRNACSGNSKVIFIRTEYVTQEQAIQLRDLLKNKYPNLNFILIVTSNEQNFREPWNISYIKNGFNTVYDNPTCLLRLLKETDPSFNNVVIHRLLDFEPEYNCTVCRHTK